MTATLLRVASGLLFAGALALFFLAFTQFDGAGPAPGGSPSASVYEAQMMRDAQVSVLFGLAGCFVLLGALACLAKAKTIGPARDSRSGPQP